MVRAIFIVEKTFEAEFRHAAGGYQRVKLLPGDIAIPSYREYMVTWWLVLRPGDMGRQDIVVLGDAMISDEYMKTNGNYIENGGRPKC